MVRGSEGAAVRSEGDEGLAGGVAPLAEAALEPAIALAADEPDDEAEPVLIRCDWCEQRKSAYEVIVKGGLLLCEDCRECGPDIDREIDRMRGK